MAAALARAAELMHAEAGTPKAVDVITTDDRYVYRPVVRTRSLVFTPSTTDA